MHLHDWIVGGTWKFIEEEYAMSTYITYSKYYIVDCLDHSKRQRKKALRALSCVEYGERSEWRLFS